MYTFIKRWLWNLKQLFGLCWDVLIYCKVGRIMIVTSLVVFSDCWWSSKGRKVPWKQNKKTVSKGHWRWRCLASPRWLPGRVHASPYLSFCLTYIDLRSWMAVTGLHNNMLFWIEKLSQSISDRKWVSLGSLIWPWALAFWLGYMAGIFHKL